MRRSCRARTEGGFNGSQFAAPLFNPGWVTLITPTSSRRIYAYREEPRRWVVVVELGGNSNVALEILWAAKDAEVPVASVSIQEPTESQGWMSPSEVLTSLEYGAWIEEEAEAIRLLAESARMAEYRPPVARIDSNGNDDIGSLPCLSPKKAEALRNVELNTLTKLDAATLDEIAEVEGIGTKLAMRIKDELKKLRIVSS